MNQNRRDLATLLDVSRFSQTALEMSENLDLETSENDIVRQSAISFQLALLGEAIKRLSPEFRDRDSRLPWRNVAGLRDILPHQYHRVNLGTIYETIDEILTTSLPRFAEQVETLELEIVLEIVPEEYL